MVSLEKISLLGNAGGFDLCSGTVCKPVLNSSLCSSVYPAVTNSGRCINLFKTLMTNACVSDCNYCVNRRGNCHRRERYSPEELVNTFLNLKRLGYVEGLFLSSGIGGNPDVVMNEMIRSVELLREKHRFMGYIHLKILPGVSRCLVERACRLVDRASINIESTNACLPELSGDKDFSDISRRLSWLSDAHVKGFLPAGLTTQFIVGGASETDSDILSLVSRLYESRGLKRVYYSTFSPVRNTPFESRKQVSPVRGYRLYQTDALLREYGFDLRDLVFSDGFLDLSVDPKVLAARASRLLVDVNDCSEIDLIKVPGFGPLACRGVTEFKRSGGRFTSFNDLKNFGVILKRALPFITVNGSGQSRISDFIAS